MRHLVIACHYARATERVECLNVFEARDVEAEFQRAGYAVTSLPEISSTPLRPQPTRRLPPLPRQETP
jgi:hypothetical protein